MKNSLTEMSRCRVAIDSAVALRAGRAGAKDDSGIGSETGDTPSSAAPGVGRRTATALRGRGSFAASGVGRCFFAMTLRRVAEGVNGCQGNGNSRYRGMSP